MNEESRVALQNIVARQALFIQATQDIADKQKALAGHIAEAAGPNAGEVSVPEPASVQLGVQPVGVEHSGSTIPMRAVRSLSLEKRSGSFVQSSHTQLPGPRDVGFVQWARLATGRVLHTVFFDYFIALCVLANAISTGIEIDMELMGQDTRVVVMLEYFFVSIYIIEMGMHFFADGLGCLWNGWVLFDFFLVLVGSLSIFFGDLLIDLLEQSGAGAGVGQRVDQVLILRMVRLFRLARALRMFSMFKSLWKLVIGFFYSLKTMASTVMFMAITIYIFACIGVELITKNDSLRETEYAATVVTVYFSSVPRIMLTLVQFATMDSIAQIYYPLIMIRPWLCVYFMGLLLTLSIAMMNLVTALVVEDALESTAKDTETQALATRRQVAKLVPLIKDIFRALDRSGDGSIQIDEIVEGIKSKQVHIPREMHDVVSLDRLLDLFEFLDLDGSGTLDEDEFVEGLCHLAITSVPVETTQILQLLRQQRREIVLLRSDVHRLQGRRPAASRAAGTAAPKVAGGGGKPAIPEMSI